MAGQSYRVAIERRKLQDSAIKGSPYKMIDIRRTVPSELVERCGDIWLIIFDRALGKVMAFPEGCMCDVLMYEEMILILGLLDRVRGSDDVKLRGVTTREIREKLIECIKKMESDLPAPREIGG